MAELSTSAVAWDRDRVAVRAIWVRANESVEWIAAATDTFVKGLRDLLDVPEWIDVTSSPWPGEVDAQQQHVRENLVAYEGRVAVGSGCDISLYGATPPSPQLTIHAGAITPGNRIPLHYAGLGFHPQSTPLSRREVVDDLIALAVRACQPAVVTFTTTAVNKESGRTGWQVPAGYRVWIGPEVGGISTTADGVTARPLEGGTLLSAPDDWEASAVAEAMNATLEANHLDEIPHGAA
ncbi:hypothetical protein [Pseudactinotalea terrae]|uniref:hypothetical protein n=1 Tax=Pseudactinotalea terrae TaxID=1743262 RepID=UPI0019D63511|nr:hypothetical protein [Pseudactinotalea terrae]